MKRGRRRALARLAGSNGCVKRSPSLSVAHQSHVFSAILAFWASRRPTRSGLHHAAADAARWRDGAFIPGSFTDKMLLERRSNSISFCVDQTWRNKDSLGPAQFPVLCSVVVGSFIWGGGGMADSVQPTQRNLYQKGVTGTYRDGTGTLYMDGAPGAGTASEPLRGRVVRRANAAPGELAGCIRRVL